MDLLEIMDALKHLKLCTRAANRAAPPHGSLFAGSMLYTCNASVYIYILAVVARDVYKYYI